MDGRGMRSFALLFFSIWLSRCLSAQGRPPEIPSRMQARFSGGDWYTPTPTFLSVESRESSDPEDAESLAGMRRRTLKALNQLSFPVVGDRSQAMLEMTLIEAPHIRYGMFHYQNAPYVYLLVRERSSGQLLYCSYRRLSRIRNESSALLEDWKHAVEKRDTTASGSLAECAEQAMRPVASNEPHVPSR